MQPEISGNRPQRESESSRTDKLQRQSRDLERRESEEESKNSKESECELEDNLIAKIQPRSGRRAHAGADQQQSDTEIIDKLKIKQPNGLETAWLGTGHRAK